MPRLRRTAKTRAYNPTADDLWWLAGLPVPRDLGPNTRMELGYPPSRGDEMQEQGLNPFRWLVHGSTDWLVPSDPMADPLERMRQLYEAAPESVRRKVPPERVRILKGTATEADLAADQERMKRLMEKIEWKTPWMRTWWTLPKEARRLIAEMGRIRYAPEHRRDEVRLAELEAEYEKKFGPRERAPYVEGSISQNGKH